MEKKIAVLAGDGIGPEVMEQALRVLDVIAEKFGHSFQMQKALVGGAAYNQYQNHFPNNTKNTCKNSDAILFGSVGGPVDKLHEEKWKSCEVNSLLSLRKAFQFNANFRPARVRPELQEICPLKNSLIEKGVDMLIVRELIGDIYFGEKKFFEKNSQKAAFDAAEYTEDQIRNIAHTAFQAAQKRRGKVTSVDKANVLHISKLWREIVMEVGQEYPQVKLEHMLVDNCAMQIITNPTQFDVILTGNMFGDILSDEAAVLPGSLGLMPSASLNQDGFGMYEPSGGSAPDIAGLGIANPIAQIESAAMMLKFSFDLPKEALAIEKAVDQTLKQGYRTGDIYLKGDTKVSTSEMTDKIIENIKKSS